MTGGIPTVAVDQLFSRLHSMFGSLWLDFLAGTDVEEAKETWAGLLRGCTAEQLADGLRRCEGMRFPPAATLFASLCRPRLDPAEAFTRCCAGRYRDDPVLFHAVQAMGGVMAMRASPYNTVAERWSSTLRRLEDDQRAGRLPAIPEPVNAPALPAPKKNAERASEEAQRQARETLESVRERHIPAGHRWALTVLRRVAGGEQLSNAAVVMASRVVALHTPSVSGEAPA